MHKRTGLRVMLDVWRALFLREAFTRISADRLGWSWIFIEPLLHLGIMVGVRQLMGRVRMATGVEFIPFLLVGLLSFFLFRNVVTKVASVVNANAALFAYRQVQPIDTVVVRAFLEGCIQFVVFFILVIVLHLLDFNILPDDAVLALFYLFMLWLLGLGLGMVFCVMVSTFRESEQFVSISMLPMMIISGAMIPVQVFPHAIQQWLWWNPVLHGVELVRVAFFSSYKAMNNLSPLYLLTWSIGLLLVGFLLQLRYKTRMLVR